jgi:ATP-dependent Lon protease
VTDAPKPENPPNAAPAGRGEEGQSIPASLPVMPVRETVLFPGIIQPLTVGRRRSLAIVQDAMLGDRLLAVVTQKDTAQEEPPLDGLYAVGCAVRVLKLVRMPDETQTVIIQAITRVRLEAYTQNDPFYRATVSPMPDILEHGPGFDAQVVTARNLIGRIIELSPRIPQEAMAIVSSIDSPGQLADFIGANMNIEAAKKQALLDEPRVAERLRLVTQYMQREIEVLELANKIQSDARGHIEETQKEYYLREQLKAIQKELGEVDEKTTLIRQLKADIEAAGMPEKVRAEADRELKRLEAMPVQSPDFNVVRTYLEYLAEMPWTRSSEDRIDLAEAERILEHDHYGLKLPKKRILEFLAVRKLKSGLRGPILCFVGPPGVGKTSLGQSIARAMSRKFVRISLGGMRDEAEIRGHRRTYVGALPGRIIMEIRKAAVNNPVFMLDEVDKLAHDWHGDPTSALLEVLDPEQNHSFTDHYLDVPFDLSKVLFIATANLMDPVPPALRDRLEVINLAGYVEEEKLAIAASALHNRGPAADRPLLHARGGRPEPGAPDRRHLPRRGPTRRHRQDQAGRHQGRNRRRVSRPRAVPARGQTPHEHARRIHGPGVDARGRRHPFHRGHEHAGHRQGQPDRPTGRGDERVGPGRPVVHPLARRAVGHPGRDVPQKRPPHPHSRGGHPEGRPQRGRGDLHGPHVAPDEP